MKAQTHKHKNGKKHTNTTAQPQYINFILDESGSMQMIKASVISGFNEYIQTLKKVQGDILFTLTKFDSMGIKIPYVAQPIGKTPELTDSSYQPGQMTPLYDAVCTTIKKVEGVVQKGQPVLIAIMTDGMENASQEFTQGDLAALIQRLQQTGLWTFVFMGANQDSWATAQKWGIPQGNVKNWDSSTLGTRHVMRSFAEATTLYTASNHASYVSMGQGTASLDFFTTEKKKKEKKKPKYI